MFNLVQLLRTFMGIVQMNAFVEWCEHASHCLRSLVDDDYEKPEPKRLWHAEFRRVLWKAVTFPVYYLIRFVIVTIKITQIVTFVKWLRVKTNNIGVNQNKEHESVTEIAFNDWVNRRFLRASDAVYGGQAYEHAYWIEKDLVKAIEYYKKGIEMSSDPWQLSRVQPYYRMCLIQKRGVPINVKTGWDFIQSSVNADNDSGWFNLGECYCYGYGVKKNVRKAVECYEKAISCKYRTQGNPRAHHALGTMYESGEGVSKS